MIERYSREEIKKIWQDQNRYKIWLEIELAAAQAMEKFKIIPKGVYKKVKSKSKIDVNKILKIVGKVRHEVIAFLLEKLPKYTQDKGKAFSYFSIVISET